MSKTIAMWSGPRNISTAMMRSWGNRADTFVCDEPLYAHYLVAAGRIDHPGYLETISRHETDWRKMVAWLSAPPPNGAAIFYQKQMAHHLLPGMSTDWVEAFENVFLIRAPGEMLSSLVEFLPSPKIEETGLPQQVELFERIADRRGATPLVVDARGMLENPAGMLTALCNQLGVPFDDAMLNWAPGPRDTDGAWGPYWYDKVYATKTFGSYRPKQCLLPDGLLPVLRECERLYQRLYPYRIGPTIESVDL